jgi:hypothetical protein
LLFSPSPHLGKPANNLILQEEVEQHDRSAPISAPAANTPTFYQLTSGKELQPNHHIYLLESLSSTLAIKNSHSVPDKAQIPMVTRIGRINGKITW